MSDFDDDFSDEIADESLGKLLKIPRAPKHLRPETRKWWRSICRSYQFEPTALSVLQLTAERWDQIQECKAAIEKDGLTIETKNGVRAHPATSIMRDARIAFSRLVRELQLDFADPDDNRPPRLGGRS